ncbi:M50 family metallopeptidase [Colwellia sp. RSH04]|uniref:M50 family metallopeptidase n=1 Tax=Colwellia sp. RSH04 TaxID=2305464 RepID=UPI0021750AD4|nr:M50 family metallopeptidase [Colwellia sp. RSH04]
MLAVIIRQIPIVSIPFNWLESYFHEISHGLAALLTGGSIIKIELFTNGAGLCTTRGGVSFVITFMGYAGATLWGWGIYTLAGAHKRVAQYFSYFILLVLACSVIFWVRDLLTLIIVAIVISMFVFLVKMKTLQYLQIVLQFMGIIILLNSLFSPMYLLDGRNLGDGAALAASTFIPELVWIVIWCALALFACLNLAKSPRKR